MCHKHCRAGERDVSEWLNVATEQRNERSANPVRMSALQIVGLMNSEDERVAQAVRETSGNAKTAISMALVAVSRDAVLRVLARVGGKAGLAIVDCERKDAHGRR